MSARKKGGRMIFTADLFCGGGGTESGLRKALADRGLRHRGIAINHWDVAVATMRANHGDVNTLQMNLENVIPDELVPGRKLDLLWASPSCTHHSRAKGGKPRSNQLRSQPELIYTWTDLLYIRRLIIENVPEFIEWTPLDAKGNPMKSMIKGYPVCRNGQDEIVHCGSCFAAFINGLASRGYIVDWRIVNCADYGDITTRRRLFVKAVRRGCGHISWPNPTHAENPGGDFFNAKLKKWRAIRECLDFNDIGRSVFNRKKPLAEKTMQRIADGVRKYCGIDLQPFLIKMYGTSKSNSVDKPIPTITAGGEHYALCQPFLVKSNNNQTIESVDRPVSTIVAGTVHHALCTPFIVEHTRGGKAIPISRPLATQTTHDRFSLLTPMVLGQQGGAECRPIDRPMPTIATSGAIRLITPFVVDNANGGIIRGIDNPINTITVKDQHMGVFPMLEDGRIVDIYIRMLKPSELAAAHSFPKDYVFTGNRGQQIMQVGNSVPVMTAAAMCGADLQEIAG